LPVKRRHLCLGFLLIFVIHIGDLAPADPDIARRHIRVDADIGIKLIHEGPAETLHLGFSLLPFGSKSLPALAAAHREPGQRVFEGLLKSQHLQNRQIDGRMETQARLCRARGRCTTEPDSLCSGGSWPASSTHLTSKRIIRFRAPAAFLISEASFSGWAAKKGFNEAANSLDGGNELFFARVFFFE
jgi:hypothetical protein